MPSFQSKPLNLSDAKIEHGVSPAPAGWLSEIAVFEAANDAEREHMMRMAQIDLLKQRVFPIGEESDNG